MEDNEWAYFAIVFLLENEKEDIFGKENMLMIF